MISNLIVMLSLLLGIIFTFIWLLRRDFREQIERPKHHFQAQVEQFEKQIKQTQLPKNTEASSHD